jgi:outer membrane protein OmpA-like peptidoglycan-associated protein
VAYAAGASALNARADEVLRALAKKLQNGAVVIITGYARHDAALAKRRSDVAAAYLEKVVGVHAVIKVVTTSTVNKVVVDAAKV